jgi:hypothetical protein
MTPNYGGDPRDAFPTPLRTLACVDSRTVSRTTVQTQPIAEGAFGMGEMEFSSFAKRGIA